ncbi:hypothetical protein ABZX95_17230 [Streptomyces sp. NPDC004232]|uniref:hypothetical protein n=1 Tax=Streptomyces sp. NPDC004232 TaxID=3154454 RepID=UPI0033B9E6F8
MADITVYDDQHPEGRPATDDEIADDEDEAKLARMRRIGDYDYDPCAEELAAAWRLSNRGAPAPEPEIEDAVVDYSIEPW